MRSRPFAATAILWLRYRRRYRNCLTAMINRVAGIDHLIFSIVPRGISSASRLRMSRQSRQLQFYLSLSLSLSALDDFFLRISIFLFPIPSRSFFSSLLFSIRYFPLGRIGFVSSPCDFNCQFTGVPVFSLPRFDDGFLRSGKWKCISCVLYMR